MEIIEFRKELAHHFDAINRHWITQYFSIEPIDDEVLLHPDKNIIQSGGAILFGSINDEVVGTVALKKHTDEVVELTKMGVYPYARNKGAGRLLIHAAFDKARSMGFTKIILFSNRKLENAIHLYRQIGFKEFESCDDLYARCDIQMEMQL